MEQARRLSLPTKSIHLFVAALSFVMLLSAAAVLPAEAQETTAFGTGALASNTTGFGDSAFGFDTLFANTTGNNNTAVGANALLSNTGDNNTAIGLSALVNNTTGVDNTASGTVALDMNTTGSRNTGTGFAALFENTTGFENVATGVEALLSNSTGFENVATGRAALFWNTTGSGNIAVGFHAGFNVRNNNNIEIGNVGADTDTNTIRIGTQGTQSRTFIAGINNSPIFASSLPVMVNINGRLGIQPSSARYKRDIHDMGDASHKLMKLRPVIFRYKEDSAGALQYGLIAEEVERVYPELVIRDSDGKVIGLRYDLLPALLLNEMQEQARENRRKDARIAALQQQLDVLKKKSAQIDALVERLSALEAQARDARPERLVAAMR